MATVGSVVVNFKANTADFSKGVKQVRNETEQLGQNLKSGKGAFSWLKENFGKKSEVGQIAALLKGAGVVGGLNLAGKQLEHFTEKMLEIKEASHSSAMSWQQLTREIANSLPLLGNFIEAGGNIAELLIGRDAAFKQLADESARMAQNKKIIEENKKTHQQSIDMALFQGRAEEANLRIATDREAQLAKANEFDKQRLQLTFDIFDEMSKIGTTYRTIRDFAGDDAKQLEEITRQENNRYKALQEQLNTKLKIIDAAEDEKIIEDLRKIEKEKREREQARHEEFLSRSANTERPTITERRTVFTVTQAPIANEEEKKQTGLLQDIADSLNGAGVEVVGLAELT